MPGVFYIGGTVILPLRGNPYIYYRNIFPKIFKNQNPYLYYSLKKYRKAFSEKSPGSTRLTGLKRQISPPKFYNSKDAVHANPH